ncbi:MAG: sxtJ [Gammaproteobacteria bacterium]|nr:sxtJ [Gammaproteobacteria bacterium]
MAMHEIKELDAKGLREFGLTTGGIVAALFGVFFPWVFDIPFERWPGWPWIVAAVLGSWGLVAPKTLRPVYIGWMKFGLLLGRITTPIIMGLVFYIVLTPMGLVRRFVSRDPMARQFDESASYRVASAKPPPKSLEKPF